MCEALNSNSIGVSASALKHLVRTVHDLADFPAGLTEVPAGRPSMRRYKDRMSYKHQLCQVDLTKVTVMVCIVRSALQLTQQDGSQAVSYEIEVEVLDVPTLLAEGAKEAEGQSSMFDDALQSILDSVRMLAKNAVPPR